MAHRSGRVLTAASVVASANLLSCVGPLTEVWVIVESNIPIAAQNASGFAQVRVQASVGGTQFWDTPYSLQDGAHALPGHFVLRPTGADENRPVELIAEAQSSAGMGIVRQRAVFTFSRGRRQVLRLFLASECAGQRQLDCEAMGRTCGQGGVCIEPERMMLPEYYPDAQVPEAGTRDASIDPSLPTPQLISPLSGSVMSTRSPTITWRYASGLPESTIDICADRACSMLLQTQTLPAGTTSFSLANVPAGNRVLFFRVFAASATGLGPSTPVWQLRLPKVDASPTAVSTALRTDADFDGDGRAEVLFDSTDRPGGQRTVKLIAGGQLMGFQPIGTGPQTTESPQLIGDIDGDGYVDAVLVAADLMNLRVFRGGPTLADFYSGTILVPKPMSIAADFGKAIVSAGDVNRDGYADFVFCGYVPTMSGQGCFLQRGGQPLPPPEFITAIGGGRAGTKLPLAAGDLDGDGFTDLAFSRVFIPSNISVWRGNMGPQPLIATETLVAPMGQATTAFHSIALGGDSNGDGRADLISASSNWQATMPIEQGGAGAWVPGAAGQLAPSMNSFVVGTAASPFGAVVAYVGDVDGDGISDGALIKGPAGSTELVLFTGRAMLGPSAVRQAVAATPTRAIGNVVGSVGDYNADGYDDVLYSEVGVSEQRSGLFIRYGAPTLPLMNSASIATGTIYGIAASQ